MPKWMAERPQVLVMEGGEGVKSAGARLLKINKPFYN